MATGLPGGVLSALAWLWQLAGHLPAVLAWADSPQRAAMLDRRRARGRRARGRLAGSRAGASLAVATGAIPVRRRVAALQREFMAGRVPAAARPGRAGPQSGQEHHRRPQRPPDPACPATPAITGPLITAASSNPNRLRWKVRLPMSTLFGVPVDAVYHIVFALTNVLTPRAWQPRRRRRHRRLHRGGPAAGHAADLPRAARAGRPGPARTGAPAAPPALRQAAGTPAARADRAVPARGHQHVRRVRAAARAVAGVQRAVPAVPLAHGGRRPEPAALARPARRAARQPLAIGRRGAQRPWDRIHRRARRPRGGLLAGGPERPATAAADRADQPGSGRHGLGPAGAHRREQGPAVHHGADRGVRAAGRCDLPDHLDRLERRRAPRLRGPGRPRRIFATGPRRAEESGGNQAGRAGGSRRRKTDSGPRRTARSLWVVADRIIPAHPHSGARRPAALRRAVGRSSAGRPSGPSGRCCSGAPRPSASTHPTAARPAGWPGRWC